MRDTLIVLNSFVHDVATGAWISALFIMTLVDSELGSISAELVSRIQDKLFWFAVASLVVIVLTGIVRGFTFRYYGWTGDVAKERKKLLMIKHAVLGVVFLAGLYYQYRLWDAI
ncbi:MAG: hypothetical protein M0Z31_06215 [Clostridia bacterium]|nr:hypothetical protein [Clostridia bacterium]